MKFGCAVIAVSDMAASRRFYEDFLGQKMSMDFDWNVSYEGGFALQSHFDEIMNLPADSILRQTHNMELAFEEEDWSGFLERLDKAEGIRLAHPPKKYPWHQNVVRLYDPDGHLVEVGEAMSAVARRLLAEGLSPEAVAEATQYPLSFVLAARDGKIE